MKHYRHLITLLAVTAVLGVNLVSLVPLASAQVSPTAIVNTGALNVRSGPGIGYSVVISLYRGTAMTMISRNSDASWIKVFLSTGAQGWVSAPFVTTNYPVINLPVEGAQPTGAAATINSGALNVRSGPGIAFGVVTSLYRGTSVTMIARNGDGSWVKIVFGGTTRGWVNSRYLLTSYPISALPVEGGGTVPPSPPPTGYRTHVVQSGENLFRISLRYGVNMYDVARLNGIVNLGLVYVGQTLLIPW